MEQSAYLWVPVGAAALAAAYFLLIPLLILASQRLRADVEILPFDRLATPPPPSLAEYLQRADESLTGLGFRSLGGFALPNSTPNVRAVLELYVHDEDREAALVSALYGITAQGPPLEVRYVEFMAQFAGGDVRVVQTNNTSEVGSFPPLPQDLTFRFPHVADLERLYRLHRALVRRHAGRQRRVLRVVEEFGGDATAYFREVVFRKAFQDQESTGYLRYNAVQDCWQPTLKGAYLMTWRELWPIKPMIRARVRRRGLRLERELQFELAIDERRQ